MFNPILIIAMPSGEVHVKEILTGYIGCKKGLVKIILDYQYDNITESMEELKILNIYERIYLKKAKFMFKISNSLTPDYLNKMFRH